MAIFRIYHATGDNMFLEVENQPRELVGQVEASDFDDAYAKSQNLFGSWNPEKPCRSTSVGDVIEHDEGFFMVCGMGFRHIDMMSKNESDQNALESQVEC